MEKLRSEIEQELFTHGAAQVGFANVTMLPCRVTVGLPRAVSVAVALNPAIVRAIVDGPTRQYYVEYGRVNDLLTKLCERTVKILTRAGCQSEAVKATTEEYDLLRLSTRIQHKTIATRAGLGWIGKSALLITKEYGPAVRLGSVLTDAEFVTGEPVDTSHCGDCRKCVDCCPAGAVAGSNWTVGIPRNSIYDAFACRDTARRLSKHQGIDSTICGICINVCPWTQKYISRELDSSR